MLTSLSYDVEHDSLNLLLIFRGVGDINGLLAIASSLNDLCE